MSFCPIPNEPICDLGKKVILSAAIFEAALGDFLTAESNKVDSLSEIFAKTPSNTVTTKDLLDVNESIKDTICCLARIEELIVEKINIGQTLMYKEDPCPPDKHKCKCQCGK